MYVKSKHLRSVVLGLTICCAAGSIVLGSSLVPEALAQLIPLSDTGFTPATPRPDPDLIIVREESYDDEGVDLTPYGIGTGPVDFVQSIYFRFFVDNTSESVDSFTGMVMFSPDIEILGIITDGDALGGSQNDGIATETDAIFGIGSDPDAYSEFFRGFESGGGIGTSEFVSITSPSTLVFGLNIEEGVDDFRVIIDYGDAFVADVAFEVWAYDVGNLGGGDFTTGFRVGDDQDMSVFGSGDYGEVGSVIDLPLTSSTEPTTNDFISYAPLSNLFILRDATLEYYVDGYDAILSLPAPDLFTLSPESFGPPTGISDGTDGKLYAVSENFRLGVIIPNNGHVTQHSLAAPDGDCVDVTNLAGDPNLYLLRDTAGGNTFVNRLSLQNYEFTGEILISQAWIPEPVGITDGADGQLYALGRGGGFSTIDPITQLVDSDNLNPPAGSYVDLTGLDSADALYLLRKTSSGVHEVDYYDIATGDTTFGFTLFDDPVNPMGITDGPSGLIYVVGKGIGQPATIITIDPSDGTILDRQSFMDFAGDNISVTNATQATTPVEPDPDDSTPHVAAALRHWAAPNPFNPRVEISYSVPQNAQVRVSVYNLAGQLVRELWNGRRAVGQHSDSWDGRDANGRMVPSGTYLYRVIVGEKVGSGKLILAK